DEHFREPGVAQHLHPRLFRIAFEPCLLDDEAVALGRGVTHFPGGFSGLGGGGRLYGFGSSPVGPFWVFVGGDTGRGGGGELITRARTGAKRSFESPIDLPFPSRRPGRRLGFMPQAAKITAAPLALAALARPRRRRRASSATGSP